MILCCSRERVARRREIAGGGRRQGGQAGAGVQGGGAKGERVEGGGQRGKERPERRLATLAPAGNVRFTVLRGNTMLADFPFQARGVGGKAEGDSPPGHIYRTRIGKPVYWLKMLKLL